MDELNRKTVDEFRQSAKMPIVVVLDNIRSMHNVGSVFRTCDAFLVEYLFLCGFTARPPHRDINKTALGSTETVNWKHFYSTLDAAKKLKEEGYTIWGVEQVDSSSKLNELTLEKEEKIALIFGNEVEGISNEVLPFCDGFIEIPQMGMKHSLNVSVAAGIVLWEMVRTKM
jgi:rRNA methylases